MPVPVVEIFPDVDILLPLEIDPVKVPVMFPALVTLNTGVPPTCKSIKSPVKPEAVLTAITVPLALPTNFPAVVPSQGPAPSENNP